MRVPSVSHLERYQGAFTGAAIALEAASTGTASAQFPWATLQAIALAYDRAAYRHHRQLDFPADWSVPQWLLAETLWQTLDRPDLLGDGTVWLQEIMAAWRSLPWDALGYPDALREGFPQGEAAIALLKNRSIRSLWQRWLRQVSGKHHPDKHFTDKHFPDTYRRDNTEEKFPISEGPNAPLTSSDLWVSLGILSRSNGHLATAINQAKDLPPLTAPREAAILGWIGATIGLMNGPSPFTSTLAAAPDSVAIAYHQGTQCFCQWAGLPSPTVPTLTPWGISLPSSPPPVTLQ
ncbi:MAG: hypothetical protein AAGF75_06800 [Cyanobacteria bacterium P01_H01_bin.130]